MKAALVLVLGLVLGMSVLALRRTAQAAPTPPTHDYAVVTVPADSSDVAVLGLLRPYTDAGYSVAGVIERQVLLHRARP